MELDGYQMRRSKLPNAGDTAAARNFSYSRCHASIACVRNSQVILCAQAAVRVICMHVLAVTRRKTYLAITDDNGGGCGPIEVDGKLWRHPIGKAGQIEPGRHT
jgi:hypothetical protein